MTVHEFDAGDMSCSEGLPQEFKRRITAIPVGAALAVVTRDPAARDDLPSLARLLGHRLRSVEPREDGSVVVTVERAK